MAMLHAIDNPIVIPWRINVSSPLPKSIEAIITRAKAGESEAVTQLYEMHIGQIYRYIAYRIPENDAEDVTSDVFINMVESLPAFTYTGAPFEAWLYRIASARVADYYRKKNRSEHVELNERLKSNHPQLEETLITAQEQQLIRDKLKNLSEDQQTLLILRFVERKSHDEVAQLLGKSVSAVKTMQHRALQRLAQLMGKDKKERYYLRGQDEQKP
jgi:RNA polymerase sigma-70 factor, ECF subfamily